LLKNLLLKGANIMGKDIMKALSMLSQIGISMFVPIFICILIGNFLDKILNTDIIFLVIFTILGVGAAFRTLYMITVYKEKKKAEEEKNNK